MSLVFEDTEELFWYPQAVLILGTVTYWAPYHTGASFWGFSGEEVTWKVPGLFCFILFFFPDCPVLGHEGLIAPIGVLSASGSEECLSKLLFSFLVFGKRKEAWRWSQAVTKWGLTPGKESWKY